MGRDAWGYLCQGGQGQAGMWLWIGVDDVESLQPAYYLPASQWACELCSTEAKSPASPASARATPPAEWCDSGRAVSAGAAAPGGILAFVDTRRAQGLVVALFSVGEGVAVDEVVIRW